MQGTPGQMVDIPLTKLSGIIGIRIYCPPTGHLTERHYLCIYSICMQFLTGWSPPPPENYEGQTDNIEPAKFIPSVSEQEQLMQELCFVISASIIENHPQMNELLKRVYPKHLEHTYSRYAGEKTTQVMISS